MVEQGGRSRQQPQRETPKWISDMDSAIKGRTKKLVGYDVEEYRFNAVSARTEAGREFFSRQVELQLLSNYRGLVNGPATPENSEKLDTARLEIEFVFGQEFLRAFEVFTAIEQDSGNIF